MSSHTISIVLLLIVCSAVVFSYSVLPGNRAYRLLRSTRSNDYIDDSVIPVEELRLKRSEEMIDPFSKRTNLKRLVILSARGFGKR
ncbi:unnamed protein product [Caenorhabditis bovis]|uniref:Uncharacterized protein n=1 Tax=Caenorhabditis bovis TaxID=2654633 RepID=A0A8S1EBZ1_9PELO|nr:unnamed protein product [Caenorhabditis bovis]